MVKQTEGPKSPNYQSNPAHNKKISNDSNENKVILEKAPSHPATIYHYQKAINFDNIPVNLAVPNITLNQKQPNDPYGILIEQRTQQSVTIPSNTSNPILLICIPPNNETIVHSEKSIGGDTQLNFTLAKEYLPLITSHLVDPTPKIDEIIANNDNQVQQKNSSHQNSFEQPPISNNLNEQCLNFKNLSRGANESFSAFSMTRVGPGPIKAAPDLRKSQSAIHCKLTSSVSTENTKDIGNTLANGGPVLIKRSWEKSNLSENLNSQSIGGGSCDNNQSKKLKVEDAFENDDEVMSADYKFPGNFNQGIQGCKECAQDDNINKISV